MGLTYLVLRFLALAGVAAALSACSAPPPEPPPPPPAAPQQAPPADVRPAPSPTEARPAEPIRSVDFSNFTFPWPREQTRIVGERSFRLENGTRAGRLGPDGRPRIWSAFLNQVDVADLTADGQADAIVGLYLLPDARSTVYGYYVYTLKGSRPHLLWSFIAKDRGEGALRRIFDENGELVVEVLGADQELVRSVPADFDRAAVQPDQFTRLRYRWDGDEFDLVSRETLPNPAANGRS